MGIILHPILEYIMFPKERITEFFSEPIYNSPVFQVGLDIPLTYHTAEWIVGGTRYEALSNPSKMPGRAFNTSAYTCPVGSYLRKIPGTICSKCYVVGAFHYEINQAAMWSNFTHLKHPRWVEAFEYLLKSKHYGIKAGDVFRWFDSGDIPEQFVLNNIIQVAEKTPHIYHWLPTHEIGIVKDYIEDGGHIPFNMAVRFSDIFLDEQTMEFQELADELNKDKEKIKHRITTLGVSTKHEGTCLAPENDNKCHTDKLKCNKCPCKYSREVFNLH